MMEAARYKIKTAKLYILINNTTFNIIRIIILMDMIYIVFKT